MDPRHAFCSWCGLPLLAAPVPAPAADLRSSGERKQVTILFADIVGSTALISGLDPEQSAAILDPLMRQMADIVADQDGFVARLTGDGIKAVFGIPATREDHAERACNAALAIRTVARDAGLRVRIGANSGEVVVRPLLNDYDAVGMAVHVAARVEQLARPGSIYLAAATARLIAGRFNLRSAGSRPAKGVRGPIELFELLDRSERTRWTVRARRGLSAFVDRTDEMATILSALHATTPVVAISGEPGAGKSRLAFELLRRRELAAWTVFRTEVEAEDTRAGLRPFARMLRGWLRVGRHDTPARIRARLSERLTELDVTEADELALQALLDLADRAAPDATQQSRIVSALRNLIAHCAAARPVLLVVEDVHWLDEDGLRLLRRLGRDAHAERLAIVLTLRTGSAPPDARCSIELRPLPQADSARLLDVALGGDPSLAEVKRRIIERAEGIPLYLEEMTRLLAHPDDAAATQPDIPESVQAIIGERIDRLPEPPRTLLRIAAAIAREVPLHLLCHVMAGDEAALEPSLRLLERSGFIRLESVGDDRRLVFGHVLTRDVAYAGMLRSDRRAIHGAILAAYEALYPQRLDEHVERLASHASEALAWQKAEFYLQRSAQIAIDRSSHAKAIRFIEEALRALDQAGLDASTRDAVELELRLLLRTAYNAIGNYRERLGNLDRAEALAQTLGRRGILPSLWISRASAILQLGQVDVAIRLCTRARQTATRGGDPGTAMIAGYMLSRTYFYAGRLTTSLTTAEKALRQLRAGPDAPRHGGGFGSSEVMLLTQLAQTSACLGRFNSALHCAESALLAAETTRRSFDLSLASYGLGIVRFYAGDPTPAISVLERGLEASEQEGTQSIYAPLGGLLSYAWFRAGRSEEARTLCRRVLAYDESSLYHANWPRLFAAMVTHDTDRDGALRLARDAAATARRWGYPVQLAWSDLILARLHREHRPGVATRHLDRAIRQCRSMALRPCLARALTELGHLRQLHGRDEEARNLWRQSARLTRAIGLEEEARLEIW